MEEVCGMGGKREMARNFFFSFFFVFFFAFLGPYGVLICFPCSLFITMFISMPICDLYISLWGSSLSQRGFLFSFFFFFFSFHVNKLFHLNFLFRLFDIGVCAVLSFRLTNTYSPHCLYLLLIFWDAGVDRQMLRRRSPKWKLSWKRSRPR